MTTIDPMPTDLSSLREQLLARLSHFEQRVRRHLALEGMTRLLAESVGLIFLSLLLDRWLKLSLGMRLAFLIACLAALARETWRLVLQPLRRRIGPVGIAAVLERTRGDSPAGRAPATDASRLTGRVATVLELPELLRSPQPPSEAMVRRAVAHCHASLQDVQFDRWINRRRFQFSVVAIGMLVLLPLLWAAVFHSTAGLWARRWLMGSDAAWPQKTYLELVGSDKGRIVVPRGEPFVVRVTTRAGSVEPETVRARLRQGREDLGTSTLTRFGPGDFRYDAAPIQSSVRLEITGGDDTLGPINIEPLDRPRIVDLQLFSQHPTEKRPQVRSFAGQDADLSFLPKTKLRLTFIANVPVAEARLKTAAGSIAPAVQRLGDRQFAIEWTHEKPVHLQIELRSAEADLTSAPTPIDVGLKSDLPPRVGLQYSGVRQRITPQATVPLSVQARDDYGIVRVDLSVKSEIPEQPTTAPSQPVSVPLMGPVQPPTEVEVQPAHSLEVSKLALVPGALLSVNASATDACYIGPQKGESRTLTFRIVPPEELFREILLRQQGERGRFRKSIDEAISIQAALGMSILSPEAAIALARRHRLLQRELARTRTTLEESMTELRLNALGSQEAFDLMGRNILTPLKQLHDGAMNEQRDALDALGAPSSAPDSKRHAEALARQEQIVTTMREVLKQMAQWDSFIDVLNQLNEIIKVQNQVHKTTGQMRDTQTESIFDK